jgi:hypothetical protein
MIDLHLFIAYKKLQSISLEAKHVALTAFGGRGAKHRTGVDPLDRAWVLLFDGRCGMDGQQRKEQLVVQLS